jgi:hypothetical protein
LKTTIEIDDELMRQLRLYNAPRLGRSIGDAVNIAIFEFVDSRLKLSKELKKFYAAERLALKMERDGDGAPDPDWEREE